MDSVFVPTSNGWELVFISSIFLHPVTGYIYVLKCMEQTIDNLLLCSRVWIEVPHGVAMRHYLFARSIWIGGCQATDMN